MQELSGNIKRKKMRQILKIYIIFCKIIAKQKSELKERNRHLNTR